MHIRDSAATPPDAAYLRSRGAEPRKRIQKAPRGELALEIADDSQSNMNSAMLATAVASYAPEPVSKPNCNDTPRF
jgi:hypothetical protein